MNWPVFSLLVSVGLLYLVIVWLTYSWMIAAPRRCLLESQLDRLDAMVGVAERVEQAGDSDIGNMVRKTIAGVRYRLRPRGWFTRTFKAVPLNQLMAAQQTVNGVSRHRAYLVPDDDLRSFAEPIFVKLRESDKASEEALRAAFDRDKTTPNGKRILVSRADELCHEQADAALRAEFDRERASLWLALVGLWGIIALGSALGHLEAMLVGAIGGFLAPIIDARNSVSNQATWGVRVLSPVGGALTAVAGLLVVSLLSQPDVSVLGEIFENVWADSTSVVALALALLFGFSGKLFSTMAITATSQIAGGTPAPAPTTPATP